MACQGLQWVENFDAIKMLYWGTQSRRVHKVDTMHNNIIQYNTRALSNELKIIKTFSMLSPLYRTYLL